MPLTDDDSKPPQEAELPHLPEVAGLSDPPPAGGPAPASNGSKPKDQHENSTSVAPVASGGNDAFIGRTFGGYQLTARIGAGGMGVVYKGRQVSLDREVAVKILNKALVDNDEFIKRFEREAKSIARISHPNIVAVYDFGQGEGVYYMVTEFVEGSNLARMIGDRLMLGLDEMLPLIAQCLAGLHHVSASGIIHRDIKPDNILVTGDKQAKIADFGLAKNVTDDKTDLTAVGLAMGTPAYMSPEQCMGRRLDVRSDVYALGVTAYFALTGEKPFVGQSSFEIMTKQREYTPPPPAQLNPRIPKEASALVLKMLAKNPQDRFRDAEECRLAWLDLGQRLGLLAATMRSGEFKFEAPKPGGKAATGEMPAMPPLPPAPVPAGAPGALSPLQLMPAAPPAAPIPTASSPPAVGLAPVAADAPAAPAEPPRREPTSEVHRSSQRTTTDRRLVPPRTGGETKATTCAKCGMLNRPGVEACQRCGAQLIELSPRDQEAQAERMLGDGNFLEAAKAFAKLADKETDRKLRSVWRSKEREARARAHERQLAELDGQSRAFADRGDLKGGLDVLERGLKEMRDAGASATETEERLTQAITALRKRLGARRRKRLVLVAAVVMVVIAAAIVAAHLAGQPANAVPPTPAGAPPR